MTRGAVKIDFGTGATVAAPPSGVHLGIGASGPLSLRLFRTGGTRIVLAAGVLPAQLMAIRVAASGAAVHVVSSRPNLWEPLLRHGTEAYIVGPGAALPPPSRPTLLIDDRPGEVRGLAEVRSWQCRLEVRTQWTPAELTSFVHADVVALGAIPSELTVTVATVFGVSAQATAPLATLAPGSFALLRRGRVECVSLDPTPAEGQLLELGR